MSKYEVTISRTETILFEVEADSPEQAEARYLMEGDETYSEESSTKVLEVRAL